MVKQPNTPTNDQNIGPNMPLGGKEQAAFVALLCDVFPVEERKAISQEFAKAETP